MRSDAVIGMYHPVAVLWIEAEDLWDEVVDLETDGEGIVTRVIH